MRSAMSLSALVRSPVQAAEASTVPACFWDTRPLTSMVMEAVTSSPVCLAFTCSTAAVHWAVSSLGGTSQRMGSVYSQVLS